MAVKKHEFIMITTLFICAFITVIMSEGEMDENSTDQISQDHSQQGRALFSPRVEYNEWLPVGRGDPLKNDPTYDYSPPVLDRVRYWAADSNSHGSQEQPIQKSDILLLGVTSKKLSSRKEPAKYHPIRRNFYSSLPTHLMPPPMQTPYHPSSQMMMMNTGWPATGSHSHKGIVSDDLFSNYVSIGLPNANLIQGEQSSHYETVNQFGQFGRPVNDKESKKPFLHHLLQKEVTPPKPRPFSIPSTVPTPSPTTMSNSNYYSTDSYVIMPSIELPTMSSPVFYQTTTQSPPSYFLPTLPPVTAPPPTIATPIRTVDTQLSNYKDDNSNSGNMYHVMIDGHSNVKTYGLRNPNETAQIRHEPKIVTVGSTEDPVIRHVVSKDDRGHNMEVKHLHMRHTNPIMEQTVKKLKEKENSAMQSLISLLDSSLGSYMEAERRNDDDKNSIQISINSSMMTSSGSGSYGDAAVRPRQRIRAI